jgi:hypothetical protein
MRRLARAWHTHPRLLSAFVVALAVTLVFASRMVFFTIYWADPSHRDQSVKSWMPPGYIARSWDIPREALFDSLGEVLHPGQRQTLEQVSQRTGIPLPTLTRMIEDAIAAHRRNTGAER